MLFQTFLYLHIISGGAALLTGAVAAIARKGNKIHRKAGLTFVYGMIITAISATVLARMHPNSFLLSIAIFSLYLTFSGWIWTMRIPLKQKKAHARLIGFGGLGSGFFLLSMAIAELPAIHYVLIVFGILQLLFSIPDLSSKKDPKENVPRHGARIGGAYIATVTAFLVVNVEFLPFYLVWLLPSVIGSILLIYRIRLWRKHTAAVPI